MVQPLRIREFMQARACSTTCCASSYPKGTKWSFKSMRARCPACMISWASDAPPHRLRSGYGTCHGCQYLFLDAEKESGECKAHLHVDVGGFRVREYPICDTDVPIEWPTLLTH